MSVMRIAVALARDRHGRVLLVRKHGTAAFMQPGGKIEPGEPIEGNSYEQLEQSLPNNLRDALRELDESEVLNQYISPDYIDIFVACKESELEEFETTISDLEYNWYLHTV